MSAVLVVVLILSLVILVGNTMIAISFLRSRRDHLRSVKGREQDAMDELHRRVQELTNRDK
jgi:C4-dicarboxylate-specific signal transduction histidine kinase